MSFAGEFHEGQSRPEFNEMELPSENDLAVLNALGLDEDVKDLSFQGIKRKLGLHQETLSRSLHRLQRDGYVEHLDQAYRISPKGLQTISLNRDWAGIKHNSRDTSVTPVLRAMLPNDVNIPELVNSLSYKWFGNLRWLGSVQTADSTTLTWITNDNAQKISVKISNDLLLIETAGRSPTLVSQAIPSSYEIFDQVWKSIKSLNRSPSSERYGKAS